MNNGFFGFPSGLDSSIIDFKEFDSSGSYIIPPKAKRLYIFAIGGGGGGGGGGRTAAATASPGGGGGGGGGFIIHDFRVDDIGTINTILSIVIGAGGTPGAGALTNGGNSTSGNAGGNTTLTIAGKPGIWISCPGGSGGNATTNTTAGAAIGARTSYVWGASALVQGGQAGGAGVSGTGTTLTLIYSHGGSGGGGVSAAGTGTLGGNVAFASISGTTPSIMSPDIARSSSLYTANGGTNATQQQFGKFSPGFGGQGGAGVATGVGTDGGRGYRGSGGGGGGGAQANNGGTGGKGGDGYVAILALS